MTQGVHVKPFLRWAGSKKQLLSRLEKFWKPEFNRYIEPFAGSCRLFFRIQPTSGILSDINSDLISMYKQVRRYPNAVGRALYSFGAGETEYYRVRSLDRSGLSPVERAAQFIFLNRFCFNGIYRTNKNGTFNVPYGGTKTGTLPTTQDLISYSNILKGTELFACDFEATLSKVKSGDFVYLDPPYASASTRVFREYHKASFNTEDVQRLRASLDELTKRGAKFVLSYANCPEVKELKKSYSYRLVRVRRHIAGFSSVRRHYEELIITNIDGTED